jgi:hypothetical protein
MHKLARNNRKFMDPPLKKISALAAHRRAANASAIVRAAKPRSQGGERPETRPATVGIGVRRRVGHDLVRH